MRSVANAATPMDVLGLTLNSPLNMPVCERSPGVIVAPPKTGSCSGHPGAVTPKFSGRAALLFAVGDLPIWIDSSSRPSPVTAYMFEGSLVGIEIFTTGVSVRDQVLGVLTKKYGKPKEKATLKVQNRYGASFDTDLYEWKFKDAYIEYMTITSSLESGRIFIATNAGKVLADKDQQESDTKARDGNRPL